MRPQFHLLLAAALLSAPAALAEVHTPDAYTNLTAVPLAPAEAPKYTNGVSELSGKESRHTEALPLQLDGAISKIKRTKYAPKREKLPMPNARKSLPSKVKALPVVMKRAKPQRAVPVVARKEKGVKIYRKSLSQVKQQLKLRHQQNVIQYQEDMPLPAAQDMPSDL